MNAKERNKSNLLDGATLNSHGFVLNYKFPEGDSGKPWGTWRTLGVGFLDNNGSFAYCVKEITINAASDHPIKLSDQVHGFREEYWFVTEGTLTVAIGESHDSMKEMTVRAGECAYIPSGVWHYAKNQNDKSVAFVELQVGPILDEEDIQRVNDPRGTPKAFALFQNYAQQNSIAKLWPPKEAVIKDPRNHPVLKPHLDARIG